MPESSSAASRDCVRTHSGPRDWRLPPGESAGTPLGPTWRRTGRGFTLLELLAVLTIIALLAAVMFGAGRRVTEAGRTVQARAELAALAAGLEAYRHQYGDYPRTADAGDLLEALLGTRGPTGAAVPGRAFIRRVHFRITNVSGADGVTRAELLDPWEQSYVYVYRTPAAGWGNPGYVLYSRGPDQAHVLVLSASGYPETTAGANADNLYASR